MWHRFTETAKRAILQGQQEAQKLNSPHVDPEHLLLGIASEKEGVATQVLFQMGIPLQQVGEVIEQRLERLEETVSSLILLSQRSKRVLELAANEAWRMRLNYIGTEHLLLAMARDKKGIVAQVLREYGLDFSMMRQHIHKYHASKKPPIPSPFSEPKPE
jgi:ATP-dependent Clp protease ATP-binding subunit ClpC